MTQVKFETVVHVELQRLGVIALSTETFSVFPGVPLNEGFERRQRWTCRRVERGMEEKKLRRSEKAREEAQAVDQSRVKSQPLSCRIGERNLSYMFSK